LSPSPELGGRPGHVETLSKKLGNPHLREDEEEGK
jgi:hypothetical protein